MKRTFARGARRTAPSSSAASSMASEPEAPHFFVYVVKVGVRQWRHEYLGGRQTTSCTTKKYAQHLADVMNLVHYAPVNGRPDGEIGSDEKWLRAIWDGLTDAERAHVEARRKAKP